MPRGRPKKKQEVEEYTEQVLESGQEDEIEEFDWLHLQKTALPKGYNGPAFEKDGKSFWIERNVKDPRQWVVCQGLVIIYHCRDKQTAKELLLNHCSGPEYRRIQ
jgi:hypothetical protein